MTHKKHPAGSTATLEGPASSPLEKLKGQHQQATAEARRNYAAMVQALADGLEVEPETGNELLTKMGLKHDDLEADLKALRELRYVEGLATGGRERLAELEREATEAKVAETKAKEALQRAHAEAVNKYWDARNLASNILQAERLRQHPRLFPQEVPSVRT